ncbi:MAG TPA: VTT domain-containing protein [Dehalococcoidia bacterium]|nr:VTT domain-containing protein [Dehalococcoidia bacterium]
MHLLAHLHGVAAAIVLCSMLFADEAGVPLPMAPSEVLLLLGGVLIQTKVLHGWVFVPAATLVMLGGMLAGYGWARLVGRTGLERAARRLGAGRVCGEVQRRMEAAGPAGVGVARLLPGVRPWATLVSGAVGVELPTFLLGAVPALLLWELVWIALGVVAGIPATRFLGLFERLILRGVLLIVLALLAYGTIRRLRTSGLLTKEHVSLATPLVAIMAGAATASLTAGTLAVLRGTLHIRHYGWVDVLVVVTVLLLSATVALVRHHPGHSRSSGIVAG